MDIIDMCIKTPSNAKKRARSHEYTRSKGKCLVRHRNQDGPNPPPSSQVHHGYAECVHREYPPVLAY
jgi:hypothetical protein